MVLLTPEEQAIQVIKSTAAHGGGFVSGGDQQWKVTPIVSSPTNSFVTVNGSILPAEDVAKETTPQEYLKTAETNTYVPVSQGVANLVRSNKLAADTNSIAMAGSVPASEIHYSFIQRDNPTQNYTPSFAGSFSIGKADNSIEMFFRNQAMTMIQRPLDMFVYGAFFNPFGLSESIAASSVRMAGGTKEQALEAAFQKEVMFYKTAVYNPPMFIGQSALSGAMYGMGGAGYMAPQITKAADIAFKGIMGIKTIDFLQEPSIEKGLDLTVGAGSYAAIGLVSGFVWKDISLLKVSSIQKGEEFTTPTGINLEAGTELAKASMARQLSFFGKDLPIYQIRYSESFGQFSMVGKKDLGFTVSGSQGIDVTKTALYSRIWKYDISMEKFSYEFPMTAANTFTVTEPYTPTGTMQNFLDGRKDYTHVVGISRGYSIYSDRIVTGKIGYDIISEGKSLQLSKEPLKINGMDYDITMENSRFLGDIYSFNGGYVTRIGKIGGMADIKSFHPSITFASGGGGGSSYGTFTKPGSGLASLGGGFTAFEGKYVDFINSPAGRDMRATTAITAGGIFKNPYSNSDNRYRINEEYSYTAYPAVRNDVTTRMEQIMVQTTGQKLSQAQSFNQSLAESQTQGMQNKISMSLGTASVLGMATGIKQDIGLKSQLQLMLQSRMATKLQMFNKYQYLVKEKFALSDEDAMGGWVNFKGKKSVINIGKKLLYGKEKVKIEPKSDWLSRIQSEWAYGKATNVPNTKKYKRAFLNEFTSPMGLFAGRMPTQEMIRDMKIKV